LNPPTPKELAAAGAPERADGEVEKDQQKRGGAEEFLVIGTLCPTLFVYPERADKDEREEEEEDAGDLEPEDSANAPEGAQKAADAAGDAAAGLNSRAGNILADGAGWKTGALWLGHGGLRAARDALARDAAGNTHASAQDAAEFLWFHSVYDGSSDPGCTAVRCLPLFAVADGPHWK